MVVTHFLVTLLEIVISIVIQISRTVLFTNLTFALQSVPDRIVIGYVGFRIQQKSKKSETKMSLKISAKSWTKALIPLVSAPLAVI